ncbi:hypothetical protein [Haloferax gibbonsii]|nr:hypothetical protein [Haloferax gibbonsii]
MESRKVLLIVTVLLITVSGCSALPESGSTPLPETKTTSEETSSLGTEQTEDVLIIRNYGKDPVNVSLTVKPDSEQLMNKSFVLESGDSFEVTREYERYTVDVTIDGKSVLDDTGIPKFKEYYITVERDGTVSVEILTI